MIICIKMDLALNNLQRLIYHKNPNNQPTNQPINQPHACVQQLYAYIDINLLTVTGPATSLISLAFALALNPFFLQDKMVLIANFSPLFIKAVK